MKEFWTKIRFTPTQKIVVIVLPFLLLGYWWSWNHVWFRINDSKITVNQAALHSDYSCFKSLNGDIFCHHQDNGTQYLISPSTNEIFTIENPDIIYLEGILFSATFQNSLYSEKVRQQLPDKIIRNVNFIQFAPSISEWKAQTVDVWRISE